MNKKVNALLILLICLVSATILLVDSEESNLYHTSF